MTVHQAVCELESRGIALQLKVTGAIALKFPPEYRRSWSDDKLIEILQASRKDVVNYLRGREDECSGFRLAEPKPDIIELRTKDIGHALQIGRAIKKGLAVLEGPVLYNTLSREVILHYRRFSPFDLEERLDYPDCPAGEVDENCWSEVSSSLEEVNGFDDEEPINGKKQGASE